ncbi:MAG: hypothetical protein HRT44_04180 [Bdellovibrionales bacterium]|nr:hypothetical protein [Bdellovibrionales bacterium]NQZ18441.1 hypothetical protein [Bdellovibrionales bacterium]
MKRIQKALRNLFFACSFITITTSYNNCGQMFGLSEEVKFDYLSSNTVFDSETLDSETTVTWLDGESFDEGMEQLHQLDDGQGDSANGDQGEGDGSNNDNGQNDDRGIASIDGGQDGNDNGGNNGQENDGQGSINVRGNNGNNDHGIDKFDQQDPGNAGITIPAPTLPGAAKNTIMQGQVARMRNCVQENGDPGFQFMRDDNMTYSACDICEVVDRVNGRCLIRVRLPDPPPRAVVVNQNNEGNDNWSNNGGDGDPLIIDVMPGYKSDEKTQLGKLNLSAPKDGVGFDIYGQRGPTPHQKMQISWTDNPRYMYLALPNTHGQILGVNELFGDSTFGPDRRYSLDGFHALSKYDGMDWRGTRRVAHADGKIDKNDQIFSRLRLWADTNFSGTAEPDEIKTLEEMGLVSIDLKYDPNFYERDVHGNEAIFKSVAEFKDGELGIVFDLWFDVDPTRPLKNAVPTFGNPMRGPASLDR